MPYTLRRCMNWNGGDRGEHVYDRMLTPCVGVWVEMQLILHTRNHISFTPHIGVWVEMSQHENSCTILPRIGIWVEMGIHQQDLSNVVSYTSCRCMSWNSLYIISSLTPTLTPRVGVWIEILSDLRTTPLSTLTPCVGVWIEIAHAKLMLVQSCLHLA